MKVGSAIRRLGEDARLRLDTALYRVEHRPSRWRDPATLDNPNTIFSRSRCAELAGHVERMAYADGQLRSRIADSRIEGVRAWEYGTLLATLGRYPERLGWNALDVGSGNSTFPLYLVNSGNVDDLVALDLPAAHELQSAANPARERAGGVRRVNGSMLELPFDAETFDLVTSISAIEHLDGDRHVEPKLAYEPYLDRTRTALREMMRVLRPGGHLFVTTDAYIPELQTTDAWRKGEPIDGTMWSSYRYEDIERTFLATIEAAGGDVADPDYDAWLLRDSIDRATYRGRFFTTFAIWARKAG